MPSPSRTKTPTKVRGGTKAMDAAPPAEPAAALRPRTPSRPPRAAAGAQPRVDSNNSPAKKRPAKQAKVHYEFGGPLGAAAIVLGLPAVIYLLYFLCNDKMCLKNPMHFDWPAFFASLRSGLSPSNLFSADATLIFLGWMAFHVLLERVLPGESIEGLKLPNGKSLKYIMSGHLQFWVSFVAMGHVLPVLREETPGAGAMSSVYSVTAFRALPLTMIYTNYVQLISVSCLFSLLLSVYLYLSSFRGSRILAAGGNTGNAVYDFFIGRELNPRLGSLDLKEFCELRPGLIGWATINVGMAMMQYRRRGAVSLSMVLINLFQGNYVWDALYQEKAILTTMDITTDGFGYMLVFGDLAWVPFIYSLQARYLVDHDPALPLYQVAAFAAVYALGLWVFRSANSQKDLFRRAPDDASVAHLRYLQTKRGTRLLVSGWWGAARKINYTGDWLITLSWCLLCGFESPVPYFQALYFAILLLHRALRDDVMCAEKYGDDWVAYKKKVPYMFVPGVF